MSKRSLRKFFLSIVLPSFMAIALFIVSIYALIIPVFEENIMDRKKEMIRELTNTAWSLIDEYYCDFTDSILTEKDAKQLAASRIGKMRYGVEGKDYFWISTMKPQMVMHPYRKELVDTDLSNYLDPMGKKLFVEAVEIVGNEDEGFIDYYWQWKDDSTRIVPKLSYVKAFKPWEWIIGTGIYLEDVKEEIESFQNRLLKISFIITLLIIFILSFVIRQSLKIENKRKRMEVRLKLSSQKYKSLVEASTSGTLMVINDHIIFANLKISNLLGLDTSELINNRVDDFFDIKLVESVKEISEPNKSFNFETKINKGKNTGEEVVLSISKVDYNKHAAIIVIVKEVSIKKQIEKETEQLTYELQTSLLLMNQPISHFVESITKCGIDESIANAAKIMTRKGQDVIFITNNEEIIGVVNDHDIRARGLAESLDIEKPVSAIMSSPLVSIKESAQLYEAILLFKAKMVSHLVVKDSRGRLIGKISNEQILSVQRNSLSYLINEIENTENVKNLKGIVKKLPVLVKALLESGALIQNITRIVTSITDAITIRIIELVIEEIGPPPCKFSFVALGSEGRMEQSLATDQDNAIIFQDTSGSKEVQHYFLDLGQKVNQTLHETGYKLCNGEVMARNPKWNQSIETWKKYFGDWIHNPGPQNIIDFSIFFDLRLIYGENYLVDELRGFVFDVVKGRDLFFHHLAQSVLKLKVPLGMFGKIKSIDDDEQHQNIDLKKIILPIIGFIRVYSLYNRICVTNTHQRIKMLFENKIFAKDLYDDQRQSYNFLMMLRFRLQANQLLNTTQPDNIIDAEELSDIEKNTLKKILSGITNIQSKLNFDFKGMS